LCAGCALGADVAGKWNVTAVTPEGSEMKAQMVLKNQGGNLAGEMISPRGTFTLQDIKVSGEELTYKIATGDSVYGIKLAVTGDSMKGTWSGADGTSGAVTAKREAAAGDSGVVGKWKAEAKSDSGREYDILLEVQNAGGQLGGTLTVPEASIPISKAKLEGDNFTFELEVDNGTYVIKAVLKDNTLKGGYTGPGGEKGTFSGVRQ
jgi:hypothetical protein